MFGISANFHSLSGSKDILNKGWGPVNHMQYAPGSMMMVVSDIHAWDVLDLLIREISSLKHIARILRLSVVWFSKFSLLQAKKSPDYGKLSLPLS